MIGEREMGDARRRERMERERESGAERKEPTLHTIVYQNNILYRKE